MILAELGGRWKTHLYFVYLDEKECGQFLEAQNQITELYPAEDMEGEAKKTRHGYSDKEPEETKAEQEETKGRTEESEVE